MPYIITTKDYPVPDTRDPGYDSWQDRQSRRAVATLEEAREAVFGEVQARRPEDRRYHDDGWTVPAALAEHLHKPGPLLTVGPLPDGTEIVVEQATWVTLWHGAGGNLRPDLRNASLGTLIAAYNAAQEQS